MTTELSQEFVSRVRTLPGVDADALVTALNTAPSVSVRLNRRKLTDASRLGYGALEPVKWCANGFYLAERPKFTLNPLLHAGAFYVQDASSMIHETIVGHLAELYGLPASPLVLDLCAAPGGKTTSMINALPDGAFVVANEVMPQRARILRENLLKWGYPDIMVTNSPAPCLAATGAVFDIVAVDAPCSGEGMFRKDDAARAEWSEQNVHRCAARQDAILDAAWRMLRAGGTLLYSTCTFNREEDEGALERLLARVGDEAVEASPVEVPEAWGIVCGRTGVFRTFRFFPHRAEGEGFFAAVARKAEEAPTPRTAVKGRRSVLAPLDRATRGELARWVTEPEAMRFAQAGDTCYGWYAEQADEVRRLSELLPVVYSGVAMGQLFKGCLRPDPALAFFAGLNRGALPAAELTEEEALAYLRKQEVAAERFAQGMNLVCREGRALGFAKRIGGRVNNLYPNALRILKNED